MSADRDRGIRRQKQKRAKALKREARDQKSVGAGAAAGKTAAPRSAPSQGG